MGAVMSPDEIREQMRKGHERARSRPPMVNGGPGDHDWSNVERYATALGNHGPPPAHVAPAIVTRSEIVNGADFVFGSAADLVPRWGDGSNVLWASGESLMIAAPPGVGKTTLATQIVGGLIGKTGSVLGYPVLPARRVLYLAMDRPRQIARAMRRYFTDDDAESLQRLIVQRGPLPADLAAEPGQLVNLARQHDCDVIVIDSLKDAAVKLSDDQVGGAVNRAIQLCNAADVDVVVLHHQRKGESGTKPTALSDVFGSTWLTAGTGSVLLLWGEAGSEQVELIHLKQPADPVGPLKLEHDHVAGATVVVRGFDPLAYLRNRGAEGATLSEVVQAEHGGPQTPGGAKWKRTERRMRRLVADGHARAEGQTKASDGRVSPSRYYAVDTLATVDTHRGHPE